MTYLDTRDGEYRAQLVDPLDHWSTRKLMRPASKRRTFMRTSLKWGLSLALALAAVSALGCRPAAVGLDNGTVGSPHEAVTP